MVFSSIEFLFLFLPVFLVLYWVVPSRAKNAVLLVASLAFYIWGGGAFVIILLVSSLIDYSAGRMVSWAQAHGRHGVVRLGVTATVVANLALLGFFKYANFFVQQVNLGAASLGLGEIVWAGIGLPIGISFFTFQSMSYTIDVARGRAECLKNPFDFLLYVALFPQLIAGPIVRYHEISDEIIQRDPRLDDLAAGSLRFIHGLAKKVIVADSAAIMADMVFSLPSDSLTAATAWIGVLAYTIQIYFDFSGYSDMAIGLGRILGFTFPENFRRPYSALSITDFWRRWHITLSNWFRDYLYIPLGGSAGSTRATYRNLMLVFLLTGFWHGANWTFIVWGMYHGGLLMIERITGQRATEDASYPAVRRAMVLLLVVLGWVVFRADSVTHALGIYRAMFSVAGAISPDLIMVMSHRVVLISLVGMSVVLLPRDFVGGLKLTLDSRPTWGIARLASLLVLFPYALALVFSGSFSPFLYFQF